MQGNGRFRDSVRTNCPQSWSVSVESLSGIVAFTRSAQLKSFAAAGRQLGISASAVGKNVARLEARLGVRLLHRSTRRVTLTEEGESFYARCVHILEELSEAEASVSQNCEAPSGRLRVEMPGRLAPLRLGIYAAPAYLERCGVPEQPEDLRGHDCLGLHYLGGDRERRWRFRQRGQDIEIPIAGRLSCSNRDAQVEAASAGLGLVQVPDYAAKAAVDSGALREVLSDWRPIGPPICAVWPSNRHLLPRVRVFVDFLVGLFAASSNNDK